MSKTILSFFGFIFLLAAAFGGGFYWKSRSCSVNTSGQTQVTPTITLTATPQVAKTATPTAAVPQVEAVFDNYNSAGVASNPTGPTTFTLAQKRTIYSIQTYHWNGAKGKTPGTIALKYQDGRIFGPWQATGAPGQGGVPDAYWTVMPNLEIPEGKYTIVDSDPASWAQNGGSRGLGMAQIFAVK